MKSSIFLVKSVLTFLGLASSITAHGANDPWMKVYGEPGFGKRLLQLAPDVRVWATPQETLEYKLDFHERTGRCGGFFDVTQNPEWDSTSVTTQLELETREPQFQQRTSRLLNEVSVEQLQATVEHLSSYFDRFYQSETGTTAAKWVAQNWKGFFTKRSEVVVTEFDHEFAQNSVILRIPGTGPLKNEKIILGGHLDSINRESLGGGPNRRKKAPGADDNASGIAVITEVARVISQSNLKFNRTVEIMGYAGEEMGLLGSQDIAQSYRRNNEPVAAVMQLDMAFHPGKAPKFALIRDHTDDALTEFVLRLNDAYVKMPTADESCGYACSDHASWDKRGYRTVYPFEAADGGMNQRLHTVNDKIEHLDMGHGQQFAKLALAYIVELAEPIE